MWHCVIFCLTQHCDWSTLLFGHIFLAFGHLGPVWHTGGPVLFSSVGGTRHWSLSLECHNLFEYTWEKDRFFSFNKMTFHTRFCIKGVYNSYLIFIFEKKNIERELPFMWKNKLSLFSKNCIEDQISACILLFQGVPNVVLLNIFQDLIKSTFIVLLEQTFFIFFSFQEYVHKLEPAKFVEYKFQHFMNTLDSKCGFTFFF